jgi:hypothetical protein
MVVPLVLLLDKLLSMLPGLDLVKVVMGVQAAASPLE